MKNIYVRIRFFAGGILLLLLGTVTCSYAAVGDRPSGAADIYQVTVTKVEFSQDGSTYFTVFEGSQTIDIASVNAGAVAASLVSGASVPPGTYTRVRATHDPTMQLSGYINIGGNTQYTNGGADGAAFSVNAGAEDTPGGDAATSSFTIPVAFRTVTDTVSFTITKNGTPPTIRLAFDTSGVITNVGGAASVGGPTVTMTSE